MEKIASKRQLVESLKDVLAVEKIARDSYIKDMAIFHHPNIISTVRKIKIDEDRHVALLEILLKFLAEG